MAGPQLPEPLRQHLEEFEESAQRFQSGLADLQSELEKAREEDLGLSHAERKELEGQYRAGLHGVELQEIQERVDQGELTWADVKSGRAGEELSEAFYDDALSNRGGSGAQGFFGEALQAAFNGVSFDDFAREHGLVEPGAEDSVEDDEDDHWDRGSQPRWRHDDEED